MPNFPPHITDHAGHSSTLADSQKSLVQVHVPSRIDKSVVLIHRVGAVGLFPVAIKPEFVHSRICSWYANIFVRA